MVFISMVTQARFCSSRWLALNAIITSRMVISTPPWVLPRLFTCLASTCMTMFPGPPSASGQWRKFM
ncbi:hypothetical protein D3C76_1714330 [compost metagenome]